MAQADIRPLVAADLPEVLRIERDTFPDPWTPQSLADSLLPGPMRALAAVDAAGKVVGYAMGLVIAPEAEVLNLAVAADQRGRGTGRALLLALLEVVRGAGATQAFLEVRRSNDAAIALYRAVGFESLGLRRSYYERPKEDALTMRLELGSQSARKG
jgi:ribosomal-protein-alanine acetyltransferase